MPVKKVGCAYGDLKYDGATFVVFSLSGSEVTLTVDDVDYVITLSKLGNDRAAADPRGETWACWYGVQVVIGLDEFKKYSRKTTQDGVVEHGSITTSPSKKATDFTVANTTCFAPFGAQTELSGWSFLSNYMQDSSNPPVIACLHLDDIYYADGFLSASAGAANSQGKEYVTSTNSAGNRPEYDFALKYAAWSGILEPFFNTGDAVTEYDGAALSDDFQYVIANTAFMPQWGDHEFQNNLGWLAGAVMGTYPNGYHKTGASSDAINNGGYDGAGLLVYNAVMAPLQGTRARNRDANANHWYVDFGAARYIALDCTTNAVSGISTVGFNQIDDVLDLASAGQWFTLLGNPASAGRGLPNYTAKIASNYPVWVSFEYKDENFIQNEYDRIYLNQSQTIASFMDNTFTKGDMGTLIMYRGDSHHAGWLYWKAPAVTGKVAESINEVGLCSVNSSTYKHVYYAGDSADFAADNSELVGAMSGYIGGPLATDYKQVSAYLIMTVTEVYGTKQTPECVVKQFNIDTFKNNSNQSTRFTNPKTETILDSENNLWRLLAARRFVRYAGNKGYDLSDSNVFSIKKLSKSSN